VRAGAPQGALASKRPVHGLNARSRQPFKLAVALEGSERAADWALPRQEDAQDRCASPRDFVPDAALRTRGGEQNGLRAETRKPLIQN
jgi:hypothetical protein